VKATRRARAGLTLVEVIISATILALLALVALNATTTVVATTNTTTIGVDLERAADKLLLELRRELRQSGYRKLTGAGTAMVWIGGTASPGTAGTGTAVRFRRRVGEGDLATAWSPSAAGTTWVEYARVSDGAFRAGAAPRYRIVRRTFDAATGTSSGSVDVLEGASDVAFTLVPADEGVGLANPLATVSVDLTMARDQLGPDGSSLRLTRRRYEDRIRLLNPR
jgi:hypothetical protein